MATIAAPRQDSQNFPDSIYWGLRSGETPSAWVETLTKAHTSRFELFECGDFDRFMADIHIALRLELPESILTPRMTLVAIRMFDEAEAEIQKAATLAPDNPMILMALADFSAGVGQRPADAAVLLEKEARIDPYSTEARGEARRNVLVPEQLAEVERQTAAALELLPDDARLLCDFGVILLYGNREAERVLIRARDLNPMLPQPRHWLCLLPAIQAFTGIATQGPPQQMTYARSGWPSAPVAAPLTDLDQARDPLPGGSVKKDGVSGLSDRASSKTLPPLGHGTQSLLTLLPICRTFGSTATALPCLHLV